jgi:soluble lytic murein transglycosylase-like protein
MDGLNDVLKSISSLNKHIEEIKNTPNKVRNDIDENLPSFGRMLNEKKTEPDTDLGSTIDRVAREEGVDKNLVRAVIRTESDFDHEARSKKGAVGLMQLMPDTASELGVDPEDPRQNIKGGVQYLGKMMDRYGNLEEALAAYNAGPAAVDEHGGVPPFGETQDYVKKVLSTFRQLKGSGS